MRDHRGNHLFLNGTKGADYVVVWEKENELIVYLNGKTTNITKVAGLKLDSFYSIGTLLGDGDDVVAYEFDRILPGGTQSFGGRGKDVVYKINGAHEGKDVESWKPGVTKSEDSKVGKVGEVEDILKIITPTGSTVNGS